MLCIAPHVNTHTKWCWYSTMLRCIITVEVWLQYRWGMIAVPLRYDCITVEVWLHYRWGMIALPLRFLWGKMRCIWTRQIQTKAPTRTPLPASAGQHGPTPTMRNCRPPFVPSQLSSVFDAFFHLIKCIGVDSWLRKKSFCWLEGVMWVVNVCFEAGVYWQVTNYPYVSARVKQT